MQNRQNPTGVSDNEAAITLGLLNVVAESSAVTQRSIAGDLGIALGLANAYLKRCARKGLIKVTQAPANRYSYYLTPQGFAEKSRLTAHYLSTSFNFFRAARDQCSETLAECAGRGWKRVILAGSGDLSDIVTLCATEHGLELLGVLGSVSKDAGSNGLPVFKNLDDAGSFDAIIVTDLQEPQKVFNQLIEIESVPEERVLAPRLLNISRVPPKLAT